LGAIVRIRRAVQTSESIELAALLTISGGLMDAYSFLFRGRVFANAQTGNIVLLSLQLADGNWGEASRYALPILCYICGLVVAHVICLHARNLSSHWRQTCLLFEIALLIAVAFVPGTHDWLANALTSLACGIQVQSFRKVHGRPIATTMCMGNTRQAVQELVDYVHRREPRALASSLLHFGAVAGFALGAILGSRMVALLGQHAILVSVALLTVAFFILFWDREEHTAAAAERRYLRERRRMRGHNAPRG
jgi:uncharacterized membrane protein YoaK (UPF0700 family)